MFMLTKKASEVGYAGDLVDFRHWEDNEGRQNSQITISIGRCKPPSL